MNEAPRLTAAERRDEIVAAASIEFAATGYAGTPTAAIARRAGVSQPYLFQLFRTKKDLFVSAVRDCFDRTRLVIETSAREVIEADQRPKDILETMGHAYVNLLQSDRGILRLQLQAYAACEDPQIQAAVVDKYSELWQTIGRVSGADPKAVENWFARGMLINVIASIRAGSTSEEFLRWQILCGEARGTNEPRPEI
jgi:AcrR family transcriptional regulator